MTKSPDEILPTSEVIMMLDDCAANKTRDPVIISLLEANRDRLAIAEEIKRYGISIDDYITGQKIVAITLISKVIKQQVTTQ